LASRAWIFDLDNTLHDARARIFPHINRSMTRYVAEYLALGEDAADSLRTTYWRRYGATLVGLIRHHDINPHHFLARTHDFPHLAGMVVGRRELGSMLGRLPGRKFLFSNAPQRYAQAILGILGVEKLFEGVFSIEHTGFRPKPDAHGFRELLRTYRLKASGCIMVEDDLENLRTAKRLGMKTVWVDATHRAPSWVDANVRHVIGLPRLLHKL
jgi:putative hydrolase of the HAD superfamily